MLIKLVFSIFFFSQLCFGVAKAGDLTIPEAIKVPEGNNVSLNVHGKGDQIFYCALSTGVYSWIWQAPDAKLYDAQNKALVGSHGAGPSWLHTDGSSVKAKVIQKTDAPDKASAPWLLLEVTEGKGDGLLAHASYIQRINTQGGLSPISSCDANHLGTEKRMAYEADYIFYSK
ncbi:MAG: DUF3455 domain-containing protein [Methyloglobulus sp.]